MIFIKELQRLNSIEHLRLIAGQDGLNRTISAAVLFEYDPSRMLLPDFYEGDLVLTTLAYARGEPELVSQSLIALLRQNVAGIMVKTAYFSNLPDNVLLLANQMGTPIFLFDNTYIEEVLLQVTDLIRGNTRFRGYEKDIRSLMRGGMSPAQVREVLKNMDALQLGDYEIIAIHPDGPLTECETAIIAALDRFHELEKLYTFMEAEQMILILHDLADPNEQYGHKGAEKLVEQLDFEHTVRCRYGVGVSSRMNNPYQIGNAFWEATISAKVSGYRKKSFVSADSLNIDAYLFPMLQNPFLVYRCRQDWAKLSTYDSENHASLAETAEIYVAKDLDVAATAAAMYQHTNTIRYRLKKIRNLIGCDSEMMFHGMLYLIVNLKRLIFEENVSI